MSFGRKPVKDSESICKISKKLLQKASEKLLVETRAVIPGITSVETLEEIPVGTPEEIPRGIPEAIRKKLQEKFRGNIWKIC